MLPLSAYLHPTGLTPNAGAELGRRAGEGAPRDAAAWFADDAGDASQVLRAPDASALAAPAAELSQRFLGCLCDG
jgi:hypothetical protein